MSIDFGSQSRIHFEADRLRQAGITDIFVCPFQVNAESFQDVATFRKNIRFLRDKVLEIRKRWKEARVIVDMYTICHPEGNFCIPSRFRRQKDIEGRIIPGYVCFLDKQRQTELLEMYRIIAEEGFEWVMIDDDFRDAFCFCDRHLELFKPFRGKTRQELAEFFNNREPLPEDIGLRRQWLDFKKQNLFDFARKIEKTLHGINPKLRIGLCISAKRCNDLSGRNLGEWLALFDSPQARIFVRLPGEHYSAYSLGISQSVGWHQYYRDLLPHEMEMLAEVTYVYPISFKSPADIRLETKIHLSGGLRVLLAWTDDYRYNGGWKMLKDEKRQFETIRKESRDFRNNAGIAVYVPENRAEYVPFDEISITEPIKAYQGLGLMGLPVRLTDRFDMSSRVTVLTGYPPHGLKDEINDYLGRGGILVIDGLAAHSFKRLAAPELIRYDISDQVSGLRMEKIIAGGEIMDEMAGFPHTSVYRMEIKQESGDGTEPISEIYDVNGNRTGLGAMIYPVGKGWIITLAYDLCRVEYRICSRAYSRFLTSIFCKAGYEPEILLSKDLFVQPLLFTHPRKRLVLINYNAYHSEVCCTGSWLREKGLADVLTGKKVDPKRVGISPLDIRILEVQAVVGS